MLCMPLEGPGGRFGKCKEEMVALRHMCECVHACPCACAHPGGGEGEGTAAKSSRSNPQPSAYGEDLLLYVWGPPSIKVLVGAEHAHKAPLTSSPLLGAGHGSKSSPSAGSNCAR